MEGWAKIKEAAKYAGVCPRTFSNWLKEGLPHAKMKTGTVLIYRGDIDEYLKGFVRKKNEVEEMVDQVLRDFNSKR
ncbi:DNA binding domain protein, excisionase family [delta proteobacterium NaphS2]|nr:DNA binding domain protein, excisionase family [delta proteobacterium NaphS2]